MQNQGLWPSGMAFALHLLRLLVKDPGFDPLLLHSIGFCFALWDCQIGVPFFRFEKLCISRDRKYFKDF